MTNLVPDATRRAALSQSGNAILAAAQNLHNAFVARIQYESIDQRVTFGKGKAIDRGFEALVPPPFHASVNSPASDPRSR